MFLLYSSTATQNKPIQQQQEIKEPTITKIDLSQKDLDELKRVLQSPRMGPMAKDARQRKIVGICGCGNIPDFIITRYYEGMQKIEKLCAKCLQQEQDKGNIKAYQA